MDECDFIAAERATQVATIAAVARVQAKMAQRGDDTCHDCGAEIDAARQLVAPFAVRCVHCQAAAERRLGRAV